MKKIVSIAIASLLSFGAQAATGKCADIEKATAEFVGTQKGGYSTVHISVWNVGNSETACYVNFDARVDEVKLAIFNADVFAADRIASLNHIASREYREAKIEQLDKFMNDFPVVAKANGVDFAVINYYYNFTNGLVSGFGLNKVYRNGKMEDR